MAPEQISLGWYKFQAGSKHIRKCIESCLSRRRHSLHHVLEEGLQFWLGSREGHLNDDQISATGEWLVLKNQQDDG